MGEAPGIRGKKKSSVGFEPAAAAHPQPLTVAGNVATTPEALANEHERDSDEMKKPAKVSAAAKQPSTERTNSARLHAAGGGMIDGNTDHTGAAEMSATESGRVTGNTIGRAEYESSAGRARDERVTIITVVLGAIICIGGVGGSFKLDMPLLKLATVPGAGVIVFAVWRYFARHTKDSTK